MKEDGHISDTAFLVSESKARLPELSGDCYAHLWCTPATQALWEEFVAASCTYDALELSLRNRYFLERLQRFVDSETSPVVANIAAGFSSYPYLLSASCRFIEVDYEHVLNFKKAKLAEWQDQGRLPCRQVEYIASDLADHQARLELAASLEQWLHQRPSFVLLEGISYYLEPTVFRQLMASIAVAQTDRALVGLEYWDKSVEQYPAYRKLQQYFSERFGLARDYTLLDRALLEALPGYELIEHTTTTELERIYCTSRHLEEFEHVLPAHFCILRRKY
jgi:O-methyltransferase involved in polyketide biosynthesis